MDSSVDDIWNDAQTFDKSLDTGVKQEGTPWQNIDHLIVQYRSKCRAVILQNFDFALSHGVEDRLWESHVKINNQFRSQLKNFRELKGRKKPVEQRKTAKLYLDFIKASQRFYRSYIQSLASRFDGVPEIEGIANRFHLGTLSIGDPLQAKPGVRDALLQSCHKTLVRLGDLSRYRETELVKKGKVHNWGPAIGYYDLAITIWPESGLPYNQLAIIAEMDDDHFSALYYLYRAFCVQEPNPTARPNIEVEMKKIQALEKWHKLNWSSVALAASHKNQTLGLASKLCFLVLHARLYKGCSFSDHEKWENDMLSCIAVDLKIGAFATNVVTRMALINIAAEFAAGERIQDARDLTEHFNAFYYFQRLNIKMLTVLLRLVQINYPNPDDSKGCSNAEINPIVQNILPALRHYSSWLLVRAKLLSAQLEEDFFKDEVLQLWRVYASILTLLNFASHKESTIMVHYLLEEDEEVAGSKLFDDDLVKHRFYFPGSSVRKPKWHNQGVKRHDPNLEMLARVRTFLQDGLTLAKDEDVPITFHASTRSFSCDVSTALERSSETHSASPSNVAFATDGMTFRELLASIPLGTSTHQMVEFGPGRDNSIEGNSTQIPHAQIPIVQAETRDGNKSSFHARNSTLTALGLVHQMRDSPKPSPPSACNSPFAPHDGEKAPSTQPNTFKHLEQQSSQDRIPTKQQSGAIPTFSADMGSSMPDPSSTETPQPRSNRGTLHQGQPKYFHSSFHSSNLFEGSYAERPSAYLATPPSGQG